MNECELKYVPVEDTPIINRIECLDNLAKSNLRMTDKQQFRRARQIGELQAMRDFVALGNKYIITAPRPYIPAADTSELQRQIQQLRTEEENILETMGNLAQQEQQGFFNNPALLLQFQTRANALFEEREEILELIAELQDAVDKANQT